MYGTSGFFGFLLLNIILTALLRFFFFFVGQNILYTVQIIPGCCFIAVTGCRSECLKPSNSSGLVASLSAS